MRAATYTRASTDTQEASPERQLHQVLQYCKSKGYAVVKQYSDFAMRGYDDDRPGFQALLRDAKNNFFDVLVVDEPSRLTRNDPLSFFALVAHPLKESGVILDTVAKGIREWDDLAGLILQTVDQHQANAEIVTLSRRVITGLARKALAGEAYSGPAPYGYDFAWVDTASGNVTHRGKRAWASKTPSNLKQILVINEDEAQVIRLIFRMYLSGECSLKGITYELRSRGVLSPRGRAHWNRSHIRNILTHRVYVGDYQFNVESAGRFHRLVFTEDGGAAVPKRLPPHGRKTNIYKNDTSDWIIITDHHEPIISREDFTRAAAMLKDNRERRTPILSKGDYALPKMLVCKNCGSWMKGDRDKSGKFYICSGYEYHGPSFCKPFRVRESDMVQICLALVAECFLSPERLDVLREEARLRERQLRDDALIAQLNKRLSLLTRQIDQGSENILLADPSLVPDLQAKLKGWAKERDEVQLALDAAMSANPVRDVENLISHIESCLWELREGVANADVSAIRRALRASLIKMELDFVEVPKAKRTFRYLSGGTAYFYSGDEFAILVQYESPFCTSVVRPNIVKQEILGRPGWGRSFPRAKPCP